MAIYISFFFLFWRMAIVFLILYILLWVFSYSWKSSWFFLLILSFSILYYLDFLSSLEFSSFSKAFISVLFSIRHIGLVYWKSESISDPQAATLPAGINIELVIPYESGVTAAALIITKLVNNPGNKTFKISFFFCSFFMFSYNLFLIIDCLISISYIFLWLFTIISNKIFCFSITII